MKKLFFSAFLLVSQALYAHNLPVNTTWESDYTPGKGTFELKVVDNKTVSVTEDKNVCGFNYLGKVSFCTEMAFFPISGELVVKPVPANRLTLVYSLKNSNFEFVHNFADEAKGFIRLLKTDESGNIVESVRLFLKN